MKLDCKVIKTYLDFPNKKPKYLNQFFVSVLLKKKKNQSNRHTCFLLGFFKKYRNATKYLHYIELIQKNKKIFIDLQCKTKNCIVYQYS